MPRIIGYIQQHECSPNVHAGLLAVVIGSCFPQQDMWMKDADNTHVNVNPRHAQMVHILSGRATHNSINYQAA